MASRKLQVAVLFGGRSTEHEISVITGQEVVKNLDTTRYTGIPVYVDQRGRWFSGEQLLDKSTYKNIPGSLDEMKEVALLPVPKTGGLTVIGGKRGFSLFGGGKPEVIPVDVFFPAFHGQFGEDGCVQGLFEMADVVYTGAPVLASAVAMHKNICKSALKANGIPVLPGIVVKKTAAQKGLAALRAEIRGTEGLGSYPLFVKPVNLGSSIGVGKASDDAGLDAALAKAFQYDYEAIVEPCVTQKLEVNVSVRESASGEPVASVTETPVASEETLTYEDKYMRGGGKKAGAANAPQGMASLTRVVDPPDLEATIKKSVSEYAVHAYRVLNCAGTVRFDFMIDLTSGKIYFNELNPLPGSMAHYLWDKSKPPVLYPQLLDDMIQRALARHEQRAGLQLDVGFKALLR